jgi:hypothetical protein
VRLAAAEAKEPSPEPELSQTTASFQAMSLRADDSVQGLNQSEVSPDWAPLVWFVELCIKKAAFIVKEALTVLTTLEGKDSSVCKREIEDILR